MTDPYRLLNKRFSLQNSTKGNSSKTIAKFYETMAKSKTTYYHFNGLKLEILGSRVYRSDLYGLVTQELMPKNSKFLWFKLENLLSVLFSAVANIAKKLPVLSVTALKNCKRCRRRRGGNKFKALPGTALTIFNRHCR